MKTRKIYPVATASGAAFCALSALGYTVEICVAQGCSITREVNVAGLSLYWLGVLAFSWLFCCERRSGCGRFGILSASLFLIAEMGLLLWQIVFLPCTNCLIVALLFGASAYAIITPWEHVAFRYIRSSFGLVLGIAIMLFIGGQISPNQFGVPRENAACTVYFSPNSEQGRKVALSALAMHESVTLIPVADSDQDIMAIADLQLKIRRGQTVMKALESPCLLEARHLSYSEKMVLKYRSFLARIELLRLGVRALPVTLTVWSDADHDEGQNGFLADDLFQCLTTPGGE